jgi:hypothetical protein
MIRRWAALALLTVLCASAGDAAAQGRGQGRGRGQDGSDGGGAKVSVSATVVFRDGDRVAFRDYVVAHKLTAEPLPPGIAKNVARGKPLPPGIAKRALPAGLLVLAPKADNDVSFAIVGNVVVASKGGVVIDVMTGVFK